MTSHITLPTVPKYIPVACKRPKMIIAWLKTLNMIWLFGKLKQNIPIIFKRNKDNYVLWEQNLDEE